jgi:hypothetical protein
MKPEDFPTWQGVDNTDMALAILFIAKESVAYEWGELFFYHNID